MITEQLGRRGSRRPEDGDADAQRDPVPDAVLAGGPLLPLPQTPHRHAEEPRTDTAPPGPDTSVPEPTPAPPGLLPQGIATAAPSGILFDPAVDRAAIPADGIGVALGDSFRLHSLPGSGYRIFLDFDGHTTTNTVWNGYWATSQIDSPAFSLDGDAAFNAAELVAIQRIWQGVAEAFSPFNIDVTTEDPGIDALAFAGPEDLTHGIRVVITDEGGKPYGGITWSGSFNFNNDTPAFVYANALGDNVHNIAVATAHEVGHALGLGHDGRNGAEYDYGHGSGATAWAPIMGVGYNATIVQWSSGQYSGATNPEDDLGIITSRNNGVTWRADEAGGIRTTAAALGGSIGSDGVAMVQRHGVIAGSGAVNDVDRYSFTVAAGGAIDLTVSAWAAAYVGSAATPVYSALPAGMLDVQLTLYFGNTVIATVDDPARLDAAISLSGLAAGTYNLAIDGTGWGSPSGATPTGWTEYGSLGQYMITGTYTATGPGDVTPPAAPLILAVADDRGPRTGPVAPGALTDDATPTLSGTAEALSRVTLRDGALVVGTAIAAADGTWSITTTALADGAHAFAAVATDAAGNVSAASAPRALSTDATAPAPPAFLAVLAAGGPLALPALSGTAEAGSLVSVFDRDALLGTVQAEASGAWAFATAALGAPGYRFTATATDAAGNVSDLSRPYAGPMTLAVDRTAVTLAEAGGSASLTVRIANAVDPTLSVAVSVAGLDPTESRASTAVLLLDAGNGWTATLTLRGFADADDDGPQVQAMTLAAPGFATANVQVTTLDDDIAATRYTHNAGGAADLAAFRAEDGVAVTTLERLTRAGSYLTDQRWSFDGLTAGDYRVHLTGSATEAMRLQRSLDGGLSWGAVRGSDGRPVTGTTWDDDYALPGVTGPVILRLIDFRSAADTVQDSVTIDLVTIAPGLPGPIA